MPFHFLNRYFGDAQRGKIIFLHIPKTGGCTFRDVLLQIYSDGYRYCEDPDVDHIKQLLAKHECVELHVGKFQGTDIYFHKNIIQKPHWNYLKNQKLFIMFRDPVNRLISNYFELARRRFVEKGVETPPLTESSLKEWEHNKQVGFLLGNHPSTRKIPNRDDLEYAKRLLSELEINVGILERYPESLQLFEYVSGRKIPSRTIQIQNQTPRPALDRINQRTRDHIREKNSLDQELYDYAMRMLDERIAKARINSDTDFRFVANT